MKRIWILLCALALLLAGCAAPEAEGPELTETEGRALIALNREGSLSTLLVTEDGEAIVLTTEINDAFCGWSSGDRVRVTHDGVSDTFPAQTEVYDYKTLAEGDWSDIPEETMTALKDLGWDFCLDVHAPAAEPQTVEDPVTGYCGNTATAVTLDGETYSFWGDDPDGHRHQPGLRPGGGVQVPPGVHRGHGVRGRLWREPDGELCPL